MLGYLIHEGTPHDGNIPHSGRYAWGSGDSPYQRYHDFYHEYLKNKDKMSQKELAAYLGCYDKFHKPQVKILKARYSIAYNEVQAARNAKVRELFEEGMKKTEIAAELGLKEQTVRDILKNQDEAKRQKVLKLSEEIKEYVDKNRYVDVGPGTNMGFGVSDNLYARALDILQEQGYVIHTPKIDQMGTGHKTTLSVLVPPDCTFSELSDHIYDVKALDAYGVTIKPDSDIPKFGIERPRSIDSSRLMIRYNEEGGLDKDGLIEIRPGLSDLNLDGSRYAQVRIVVDDTHYIKGMCVYNPDLPPGVDILFNTNKHAGVPAIAENPGDKEVLKPLERIKNGEHAGEIDWERPFGASVQQIQDPDGNVTNAINFVNREGKWKDWDKKLASQFLSKQPLYSIENQLKLSLLDKQAEFDKICSLTNPAVKQELLKTFSEKCDSDACELKAHAFPGQQAHVLLPMPTLKDNECYCPDLKDGTMVALVRYPHQGIFEIPILRVNNANREGRSMIGILTPDAIGINHNNANRLSGADYDGDAVTVIPLSDKVHVQNSPAVKELIEFDPKENYPGYEGMKKMTARQKGIEMGRATNILNDMSINGASLDKIYKATKHTMVVIDAEKHGLNWRLSEEENEINSFREEFQKNPDGTHGPSTIISRASSKIEIPQREGWNFSKGGINPETGEKIYKETGDKYYEAKLRTMVTSDGERVPVDRIMTEKNTGYKYYIKADPSTGKKVREYVDDDEYEKGTKVILNKTKDGQWYRNVTDPDTGKKVRRYVSEDEISGGFDGIKEKPRTQKIERMAFVNDAFEITSGGSREKTINQKEIAYANYANGLKSLANSARLAYLNTENLKYDKDAAEKYAPEVNSLKDKLMLSKSNAPRERQAQLLAGRAVSLKKESNPELVLKENKASLQRVQDRAIYAARKQVGAESYEIDITDREWEAIQSGALRHTTVRNIISNANLEKVRERSMPRTKKSITPAMISLAKTLANSNGFSTAYIAERLGVSTSTVSDILNGEIVA